MSRKEPRPTPARRVAAPLPSSRRRLLRWTLGIAAVIAVIGAGVWLSTTNTTPSPAATGDVAGGEVLFSDNCTRCHGVEATGTQSGPPLVHELYIPGHHADAAFLLAVRNGVRPHHWNFGPMPPIAGLTDDDVTDIVAYVRSLQRSGGLINDGS